MIGKLFITRQGYDPQLGHHVKDPHLGKLPSIGACRPDFRSMLRPHDHIFVISGRVRGANQFVMGGFEIAEKLTAIEAYERFPEQRLRRRRDGQLTGNVIVNRWGRQHRLDDHKNFPRRIENYIVGMNPIVIASEEEIARCRAETMEALQSILHKEGEHPIDIVGRWGIQLTEAQVVDLRAWLSGLKSASGFASGD